MKYRKRIYYTEADKALMWDRWQRGDTLHEIARLFDRHHSSVRGILERTGGIRPPVRRRSSRSLTLAEREEISRGIASGRSLRSIALRLGRSPSTIGRELTRNGGRHSYRAHEADQAAWDQALRPKTCKLALNRPLARIVARQLRLQWSPWQIAGWLKQAYEHDETRRVSHETIYKTKRPSANAMNTPGKPEDPSSVSSRPTGRSTFASTSTTSRSDRPHTAPTRQSTGPTES